MVTNSNINNIDWKDVIKKEARGLNDENLGEIQEVGSTYVLTEKGLLNKEQFYLPIDLVEGFDGNILRFKMTEEDARSHLSEETQTFPENSSIEGSDISNDQETTIPLKGEKLDISKRIEEEEIKIIKEPVTETTTVTVELTHEKMTMDRRQPSERATSMSKKEGPVKSKTEIIVRLKREEPVIIKHPYVKEEIVVKRKPIIETRTVKEEVTNEKVIGDNDVQKEALS